MSQKYNIFIEGIPGSGKSTLLNSLAEQLDAYQAYREGDISPVELAWCAYMDEAQYRQALVEMPNLKAEIELLTVKEKEHFITAYTRIRTEDRQFYSYMEKYEIYGGRKNPPEFKAIIFQRFSDFHTCGNLFECSFFQNIIDELMLFQLLSENQIKEFYKEMISLLDLAKFRLVRFVPSDMKQSIETIKAERVNEKGEEVWYQMMLDYLSGSPYGKIHGVKNFEDMVAYFMDRIEIENKVMGLLPANCCIHLESKNYQTSDIISQFLQ